MATQTYPPPPTPVTQIADSLETTINPATEDTLQTLLGQAARNIRDVNNTNDPLAALGAGTSYTGTYTDIRDQGVVTVFFLSDQRPEYTNGVDDTDGYEVYIEWSPDGVTSPNPALDLLARAQVTIKEVAVAGFPQLFVGVDYLTQPHIKEFYRLYYENGPVAQTPVISRIDSWLSKEAFTGTFLQLDEELSDLSISLLTRSVIAGDVVDGLGVPTGDFENVRVSPSSSLNTALPSVEIFRYATPDNPNIPTGPTPTINAVLNTEANVVDTGWFPATLYPGGSRILARTGFGGGTVKVFIANASDDQGSNAEGLLFALTDTSITSPAVNGADFFDRYSRIIVVNDSGTDTSDITIRVVGAQVPQPGVTSSISSQMLDFFPATLNKSALFGKVPNTPFLKLLEITTNGFLNVSADSFLREVSLGRVAGHSIIEIQGASDAVGTAYEDVWFVTGLLDNPITADTVTLTSTSPLDTSGGTGVREVELTGLDANYDPLTESIVLNGVLPVTTTSNFLRVFTMRAVDVGTLEAAAGIITGIHDDTSLPIARMGSGVQASSKTQYTIPNGKVAILVEEEVNVSAGDTADFRFQAKAFGANVFRTSRLQAVGGGAVTRSVEATQNIFQPKSDLRWQARKIGIGTTPATVNYSLMLIDEDLV